MRLVVRTLTKPGCLVQLELTSPVLLKLLLAGLSQPPASVLVEAETCHTVRSEPLDAYVVRYDLPVGMRNLNVGFEVGTSFIGFVVDEHTPSGDPGKPIRRHRRAADGDTVEDDRVRSASSITSNESACETGVGWSTSSNLTS
jgi:hypothetical protein